MINENNNENNENFDMFSPEDIYKEVEESQDDSVEDEFDSESFDDEFRRRLSEEKHQKHIKLLKGIIIAAICVAVLITALLIAFTSVGDTYRKNFKNNFNKLFYTEQAIDIGATEKNPSVQEYVSEEREITVKTIQNTGKNVTVVPFEGASSGKFAAYRNGLLCVKSNHISFIDSNGAVSWEQSTTVADPILSVDGRYAAIASRDGYKLCLYNGDEKVFEANTDEKIKNMKTSANGDVVLVCDKENYKGSISVYNKEGKEIFSWSSGKYDIINADISSASRRVATTLLNTNNKVCSVIKIFDISSKNNNIETVFDDTVIFNIDYTGDTVTGFGDNSLVCVASTGSVISDKRFDRVSINHYAYDSDGYKLVHFDSAGIPVFHLYGKKGVLKSEMIIDNASDYIDINNDLVLYNDNRSVFLRRMGSEHINEYTAVMDILDLILINSRTYGIIHSNSIEIVGV